MQQRLQQFVVDKDKIAAGDYRTDQTNPASSIPYIRNSAGTVVIDSNTQNIDNNRLVINLISTQYKLNSFENIIDTEFTEFVQEIPDVTIEDLTTVTDLSGEVNNLQNQIKVKNNQISDLTATVEELTNTLNSITPATATGAEATNVADAIQAAIAAAAQPPAEETKPRIFSDGTLLRDDIYLTGAANFYYIMENGKKRLIRDENVLNLVARASGKQKLSGTNTMIPDLIDTPQYILDEIPNGAEFTANDLVKNKPTDPPPPIELAGRNLLARWIYPENGTGKTADNPIIIETTNTTPTQTELTLFTQLQFASAEGIVNRIEIWDMNDGTQWFDGKVPLPIKDRSSDVTQYRLFKISDRQQYTDNISIVLKNSDLKLKSGTASNGQPFIDRYEPIKLSIQNYEFNLALTPKIFNDNGDMYHDFQEILYVSVKFKSAMPNLISLTEASARTQLNTIGIPDNQITVINGSRTNDSNLFNKIQKTEPEKNTLVSSNSSVRLFKYIPGLIRLDGSITGTYPTAVPSDLFTLVRSLKSKGFINFEITAVSMISYNSEHRKVYKYRRQNGNVINTHSSQDIPYDEILKFEIYIHSNEVSPTYGRNYSYLTIDQIISEYNNFISLL